MVTLPGLDTYSAAELAEVDAQSPAFARYRRMVADHDLDALRARRHRGWTECVAATVLNRASAADVCAFWSHIADDVLSTAWRECGLDQVPALLLAFGKLGAGELNLSSDVDLLIVAEPPAASAAMRGLREFRKRLGDDGTSGFCFRLDFDLRPGGRDGPLVTTPAQFQDHYWTRGEPWERLAMMRLRAITGDDTLRARIEDLTQRFAYRRHLDFTLIEDLRVLRAAVHARGFTRRPNEIHLKLEVGGIRDVELFTHLQQVMHGGRLPELRVRSVSEALRRLVEFEILNLDTATTLDRSYWALRDLENRVQEVDDRQTHELPEGPRSNDARKVMAEVHRLVSDLLGLEANVTALPATAEAQASWLADLGFDRVTRGEVWPRLIASTAHSRHVERDERARLNFLFGIVRAIARLPNRDRGLATLADFVRAVRGKASLFTLFLRQPELIDDVARYVCASPYLGAVLAARPELLDQLVRPVPTVWSTDQARMLDQLSEQKLLTEIWAANQLQIGTPVAEICSRISDVADGIARRLLSQLKVEYPGTDVRLLALGKWGGRELGLRSDLDFVFITDREPTPDDQRVARRFITRITDPSGFGALYDVDLRLRPSGQSGPLMLTTAKLHEYWRRSAAPWERQAYLRTRSIDGDFSREGLCDRAVTPEDLAELRRIRLALRREPTADRLDLKHAPGGLIDIEFAAQTALLIRRIEDAPASTAGMIEYLAARIEGWHEAGAPLIGVYDELRRIEQGLQLTATRKMTEVNVDPHDSARAADYLGYANLWDQAQLALRRGRDLISELPD